MTLVRCLKTQFWDEKKIYCCRKKTSRSYDVLRRSSKMKRRFTVVERNIAIVRCLETQFWDEKKNLLLLKENITFVQCLEMQFWDEKKNLLLSKETVRSYDVLKRSSEMKRKSTVIERKHHARTMSWDAVLKWKEDLLLSKETLRSYDVLRRSSEMKKRIYCCRKKTSRSYDVLKCSSEMKKRIHCCRKKQCDRTMSWNAVLRWKKDLLLSKENITLVRCLEMQFWDEKKNLLLSKEIMRSYDVLKRSSEMKRRIYCCSKKQCDRTMSWDAILKWKEEFIVVEKNIAIVRCLETQFWNEKKNLLLSKETSRSYDVLKCSSEMKRRIYCCRKKQCDRTMSWNAVLRWKEDLLLSKENITLVRCLEMQFWDEKKNLLLSKETMRSYDVLRRNSEMKRKIYCCSKKTSRSYDVLKCSFVMKRKIYYCQKKTSRSYKILKRNSEMNSIHWY
jgi:uncharacterized pyridoxamine 5'-phosphate oxidase family protein